MSDDTVKLHDLKVVEVSEIVQQEVVKELEDLLQAAREGKLQGLLYAAPMAGEGHTIGACGNWASGYEMLGVAHTLVRHTADLVEQAGHVFDDE